MSFNQDQRICNQRYIIDKNRLKIITDMNNIECMNYLRSRDILSRDECDQIQLGQTTTERNNILIDILRTKTDILDLLIQHFTDNNQQHLTDLLIDSIQEHSTCSINTSLKTNEELLNIYITSVKEYYKKQFSTIHFFDTYSKSIDQIWVNLRLVEQQYRVEPQSFEDYNICISEYYKDQDFILIKGQPGIGKTTLIKKIANDWAIENEEAIEIIKFKLILVLTFREETQGDKLLLMALNQLFNKINFNDCGMGKIEKIIKNQIKIDKNSVLLLCDGYDEYIGNCEETNKHFTSEYDPPVWRQKTLITSRPYAIKNIKGTKQCYEIQGIMENQINQFLFAYCSNQDSANRLKKHLINKNELFLEISKNPLFLMLLCLLSDTNQDLPINLTSLYRKFIDQLMNRSKVTKYAQDNDWSNKDLIKQLSQLAFEKINEKQTSGLIGKYIFGCEDLEKYNIRENEILKVGLILKRRNENQFPIINALYDFPHRSFQDLFAAIYLKNSIELKRSDINNILQKLKNPVQRDSYYNWYSNNESKEQFLRFFFGLLSDNAVNNFCQLIINNTKQSDRSIQFLESHIILLNSDKIFCDCNETVKIKLICLIKNLIEFEIGNINKTVSTDFEFAFSYNRYFTHHLIQSIKTFKPFNLIPDFVISLSCSMNDKVINRMDFYPKTYMSNGRSNSNNCINRLIKFFKRKSSSTFSSNIQCDMKYIEGGKSCLSIQNKSNCTDIDYFGLNIGNIENDENIPKIELNFGVEDLYVSGYKIHKGIEFMLEFPLILRALRLRNIKIDNILLESLSGLNNLSFLAFMFCPFLLDSMEAFQNLTFKNSLTELWIVGLTKPFDKTIQLITELSALEQLELSMYDLSNTNLCNYYFFSVYDEEDSKDYFQTEISQGQIEFLFRIISKHDKLCQLVLEGITIFANPDTFQTVPEFLMEWNNFKEIIFKDCNISCRQTEALMEYFHSNNIDHKWDPNGLDRLEIFKD